MIINNLFMIIGKSISKSPNRKIEYTLLNLYTSEIDYIDLTVAEVQTFNPLEEPTKPSFSFPKILF